MREEAESLILLFLFFWSALRHILMPETKIFKFLYWLFGDVTKCLD